MPKLWTHVKGSASQPPKRKRKLLTILQKAAHREKSRRWKHFGIFKEQQRAKLDAAMFADKLTLHNKRRGFIDERTALWERMKLNRIEQFHIARMVMHNDVVGLSKRRYKEKEWRSVSQFGCDCSGPCPCHEDHEKLWQFVDFQQVGEGCASTSPPALIPTL